MISTRAAGTNTPACSNAMCSKSS